MVKIIMQAAVPEGGCNEWAMVELQGDLETKSQSSSLSSKFIGDLHYTRKGIPVLIIGHHILYGKAVALEKPFLAMTKVQQPEQDGSEVVAMETDQPQSSDTVYKVQGVIKKKLVFKTRPKPIIANVPKKV